MTFQPRRTNPHEQVIHRLLRHIVRFALRRAIYIQDFIDILKGVYVEVAEQEIAARNEKANISRLSVATGLPRKDVTLFFRPTAKAPEIQNFLSRIVGQWEQDRKYRAKSGGPRVLSYGTEESEFSQLVRSVSRHVGAAAVLAELERNGVVSRVPAGLRLERATVDFTLDHLNAYDLISQDMGDLVSSLEHNLGHPVEEQNMHYRTVFDNIYLTELPKIRKWLVKEGRAFHARVREFLAECDKDVNPTRHTGDPAGGRVMVTAFSYLEAVQESHTEERPLKTGNEG